jgi:hypothetical protein
VLEVICAEVGLKDAAPEPPIDGDENAGSDSDTGRVLAASRVKKG